MLAQLAQVAGGQLLSGDPSVEILGLAYDSRTTASGDLFVCIRGYEVDGHDHARAALDRGARGLVVEHPLQLAAPQVLVADARQALLALSRCLAGDPASRLLMVGVTGTNGKTTVAYLTRHLLGRDGRGVGLVGTVECIVAGKSSVPQRTTPESRDLYYMLRDMVAGGDSAAVLEVSSHALALKRVRPGDFAVGIFTNLSQDHLDFHGDMDDYLATKAQLFAGLGGIGGGPAAVINLDDQRGPALARLSAQPVLTYGLAEAADVRAVDVNLHPAGSGFDLHYQGRCWPVSLPLAGTFNVCNALAAAAAAICCGMVPDEVAAALASAPQVPGRFERLDRGQPFGVVVDYAHTPDALVNVLRAARGVTAGRIILVFGCGGDRDRSKRPLMGQVAASMADVVIVTSDNPRSECPDRVIADVITGCTKGAGSAAGSVVTEPDRRSAIQLAIDRALPGDLVLIAGKGHEPYQELSCGRIEFDDRLVAMAILAEAGERP